MPLEITGLPMGMSAGYPIRRCYFCGSENNVLHLEGDEVLWSCLNCSRPYKIASKADLLALLNYCKTRK